MELEKTIIGSVLANPNCYYNICSILTTDCFTSYETQSIWDIFKDLEDRGIEPDMVATKSSISRKKLDIPIIFLVECYDVITSTSNVENYALILLEERNKRRIKEVGNQIVCDSESELESREIIESAQKSFIDMAAKKSRSAKLTTLGAEMIKQAIAASKNDSELTGIDTGFKKVNQVTSGWQNSDLIILAARPGMGKTSMALSLAVNAAKSGTSVGFLSMEMSAMQLAQRLVSMHSGVPTQKIRGGRMREDEWVLFQKGVESLDGLKILIDDSPALTPFECSGIAKRWKIRHDIGILFVDYLQLMRSTKKSGSREQEVSDISGSLKALAKTLDIPVVALSQLSRAVETRSGDKRPILSDLRDSGSIEQDADIVTFLYRPEYYELAEEGDQSLAEFNFAKHRNGALSTIELDFIAENTKFIDRSESDGFVRDDSVVPF